MGNGWDWTRTERDRQRTEWKAAADRADRMRSAHGSDADLEQCECEPTARCMRSRCGWTVCR